MPLPKLIVSILIALVSGLVLFFIVEIITDDGLKLKPVPIRTGLLSWLSLMSLIGYGWFSGFLNAPSYFFTALFISGSIGSVIATWFFFPMKDS